MTDAIQTLSVFAPFDAIAREQSVVHYVDVLRRRLRMGVLFSGSLFFCQPPEKKDKRTSVSQGTSSTEDKIM